MDPVVLGSRIRALRVKLKLTQKQVAMRANVAENTIRGLEKGTLQTRRQKYEQIAAALLTTTELLERPTETIAEDHPLLVGLNDDDLQIAQAYSRARTPTRLRVERLLLTARADAGFDLLERIEMLDAHHKEGLLLALAQHEKALAEERAKEHRKPRKP